MKTIPWNQKKTNQLIHGQHITCTRVKTTAITFYRRCWVCFFFIVIIICKVVNQQTHKTNKNKSRGSQLSIVYSLHIQTIIIYLQQVTTLYKWNKLIQCWCETLTQTL
jgi:hypothetical protein